MFYELQHSMDSDYFHIKSENDFNYPAHMHHCFEFLVILEGTMTVEISDTLYEVHQGESLIIFPNQLHKMSTVGHSNHLLCIFSPKLVKAYTELTTSLIPKDNRFTPNPFYIDQFKAIFHDYRTNKEKTISSITLKGFLYSICAEFHKNAEYKDADVASSSLLFSIFRFINDNYKKSCTLNDLAKQIGYEYSYLSRFFKKSVGISYNSYVNQSRIREACYLLCNTELSILEVSTECGFTSLRSLNRNFKFETGMTPAEYKKKQKEVLGK